MRKLELSPKYGSQSRAVDIAGLVKRKGGVLVTTNGIFDILHAGHIRFLSEAKALGDFLMVFVNSDESARRIRGEHKPYIPCRERMEVLGALEVVDFVSFFEEDTPVVILGKIKPDIHIKASEWKEGEVPEAKVIQEHGGKMIYLQTHSKELLSTTAIATRIFERELQIRGKLTRLTDPTHPEFQGFRQKCSIPIPLDLKEPGSRLERVGFYRQGVLSQLSEFELIMKDLEHKGIDIFNINDMQPEISGRKIEFPDGIYEIEKIWNIESPIESRLTPHNLIGYKARRIIEKREGKIITGNISDLPDELLKPIRAAISSGASSEEVERLFQEKLLMGAPILIGKEKYKILAVWKEEDKFKPRPLEREDPLAGIKFKAKRISGIQDLGDSRFWKRSNPVNVSFERREAK